MKKLTLKLEGMEMLTKEQMKKIGGGKLCPCSVTLYCSNGMTAGSANVDCGDVGECDDLCDIAYPGTYCYFCYCPAC